MPVITIALGESSDDQKRELISKVTQAAVDVTGIPADSFLVFIDEYGYNNIGKGGRTFADIKADKS
jgi:4-oxalocrotonate tautomerase